MQQQKHLHWLDIAKGIGILLVIVGHCVFPNHLLIDSFHMPLFFVLAGLTFKIKPISTFLLSKINRIGVPFIFWSIASALLALIPHPYTGPFNGPLWFLQTIFVALIAAYLILQLRLRIQLIVNMLIVVAIAAALQYNSLEILPFHLVRGLTAYIYIVTGFYLSKYIIRSYSRKLLFLIFCISALAFAILFVYLYLHLPSNAAFFNLSLFKHVPVAVFLCSLSGISMVLFLCRLIEKSKPLEYLGINSLVIMCVHFPLAQILNVAVSQLPFYGNIYLRSLCALVEYAIVLLFSIAMIVFCKKYLPKLTGYTPLIS